MAEGQIIKTSSLKEEYNMDVLSVSFGALSGAIANKMVPSTMFGGLSNYATLILGVISGLVGYFMNGHLRDFFAGASVFLVADGILRILSPSYAV
jgi:uncharacterized membrane protein YeaQ/YmgE (transglycosylase-associated protein family)